MKRLLVLFLALSACASAQKFPAQKPATNPNGAAVRALFDQWKKAFNAGDVNGVMALYAPGAEVVAFDIVPPLAYRGHDAYAKDYQEFFAMFNGHVTVELKDMVVYAGDDVAFAFCFDHLTGTLKNGQKMDMWIRATSGLRKINGKWLIVHDHISVPADLDHGKAVTDLKP